MQFLEVCNPKTVVDIASSVNPSLAVIKKANNGDIVLKAMLVKVIGGLIGFFNVGKAMNGLQIAATVELLIEAYSVYKIDDFVLCFKYAKMGHYGTTYDRIDGNVIFEWFEKYLEHRAAEFERLRMIEQKNLEKSEKEEIKAVPMPDYIKDLIVKKTPDKPKSEYILNNTDQQKKINGWMLDFDELWSIQGANRGIRMVEIDDVKMDISKYLYYRNEIENRPKLNQNKGTIDI